MYAHLFGGMALLSTKNSSEKTKLSSGELFGI
jgi:hypothetical protein